MFEWKKQKKCRICIIIRNTSEKRKNTEVSLWKRKTKIQIYIYIYIYIYYIFYIYIYIIYFIYIYIYIYIYILYIIYIYNKKGKCAPNTKPNEVNKSSTVYKSKSDACQILFFRIRVMLFTVKSSCCI